MCVVVCLYLLCNRVIMNEVYGVCIMMCLYELCNGMIVNEVDEVFIVVVQAL